MGETIVMLVTAIAFVAGVYLVTTADDGTPRLAGAIITGVLGLSAAMQVVGYVGNSGHGVDALVAVATFAGCAALVGGVVFYIRSRPQTFDDRTQEAPTTAGQYAANTPAMPRRGRI